LSDTQAMMLTTATQTLDISITLTNNHQEFAVLELQGDHAINEGFDFTVCLATEMSLLSCLVTLTVQTPDDFIAQKFQGIVIAQSIARARSELRIVSRLYQLNTIHQSLLYTEQSVIDIIKKLLENVGYARTCIRTALVNDYPLREHYLQTSHETSGDFLARLLAESGLFLLSFFDDILQAEVVMIADNNQAFILRKPLQYFEASGMTSDLAYIYNIISCAQKTLSTTTVQTRSEYSSRSTLSGQAFLNNKPTNGKTYFGKSATSERELIQSAKIYLKAETIGQTPAIIHSTDASLAAGQRLDIDADDTDEIYSGCFLVLRVTHQKTDGKPAYYNTAELLPAAYVYRTPQPNLKTFPITLQGKLINTPFPLLDSRGKQTLIPDHIDSTLSKPLPRMQPHTGAGKQAFGIHLPLSHSAEIMATSLNGNREDFLILSSLYNDQHLSPVTQKNSTENIVRSYSGNSLIINDSEKDSTIQLNTMNENHHVMFDNTNHKIAISSKQGGMNIRAKKNVQYQSGADMQEKTNAIHQTIISGKQSLNIAKNFQHQSNRDITLSSLKSLSQNAKNNFQINSGTDLLINCEKDTNFEVTQGDLHCLVEQGHVTLTAKNELQLMNIGDGDIHIQNGDCGTLISADGTITCYGDTVLLQADNAITLNGRVNYASKIETPLPPDTLSKLPLLTSNFIALSSTQPLRLCNDLPTPAPETILGNCNYYQFRHDDFIHRHRDCSMHLTPSYYLNYGLFYCKKFSVELYPKLSSAGKIWLPKARWLLQKYLEEGLAKTSGHMQTTYRDRNNPTANELNDEEFTDFVFNTHYFAYKEAGYKNLTFEDTINIFNTISWAEKLSENTLNVGISLKLEEDIEHLNYEDKITSLSIICSHLSGLVLCRKKP